MKKIALILIYNIFATKKSFLGMTMKKKKIDPYVFCRAARDGKPTYF